MSTKELTKDQKDMFDKFNKAKLTVETIVAQKLKLEIGQFAFLKYMYSEDIKKSEVVENDFKAHIFYDVILDQYTNVAGAALDKVKWESERYYKLTFNGEIETGKKQRFNAWLVEVLPKDFKL